MIALGKEANTIAFQNTSASVKVISACGIIVSTIPTNPSTGSKGTGADLPLLSSRRESLFQLGNGTVPAKSLPGQDLLRTA